MQGFRKILAQLSPGKKRARSPLLEEGGIKKRRVSPPRGSRAYRSLSPPSGDLDLDYTLDPSTIPTPPTTPMKRTSSRGTSLFTTQSANNAENRVVVRPRSPKKSLAARQSPVAKDLLRPKSLSPAPTEVIATISDTFGVAFPLATTKLNAEGRKPPITLDDLRKRHPIADIPSKDKKTKGKKKEKKRREVTTEPETPRKRPARMPEDWVGPKPTGTTTVTEASTSTAMLLSTPTKPATPIEDRATPVTPTKDTPSSTGMELSTPRKPIKMPADWRGPGPHADDPTTPTKPASSGRKVLLWHTCAQNEETGASKHKSQAAGTSPPGLSHAGTSTDLEERHRSPSSSLRISSSRFSRRMSPYQYEAGLRTQKLARTVYDTLLHMREERQEIDELLKKKLERSEEKGVQTDAPAAPELSITSNTQLSPAWASYIDAHLSLAGSMIPAGQIMARVYDRTAKWLVLFDASNPGPLNVRSDMPWPTLRDPVMGHEIGIQQVRDYVLSPYRIDTWRATPVERVRHEKRKWLSVSFADVTGKFLEEERVDMMTTVVHVVRVLSALEEEVEAW